MDFTAGDLESMVGRDLLALIRARAERLTALTEVSSMPSPVRRRAAFRLAFEGGLTLKGRRFETPERAERVERILALTGDGFPPMIARRGDALLLPWVEGATLASLDPVPPAAHAQCGRILGGLHRVAPPEFPGLGVGGPEDRLARLRRHLGALVDAGEIDDGLARAAVDAAARLAPGRARSGIIHRDFCAENIVLDISGAPVSIDNANLSVGPCDLDLARTWYRWPMSVEERRRFLAGYEESSPTDAFRQHFGFWAICVLAGSAANRLRAQVGRQREPLVRLRSVLADLERDPAARSLWGE